MNKKGAELSLNVIIIAAIGLLILVILAVLVINYTGGFNKGAQCTKAGGICKSPCSDPLNNVPSDACETGKTCCRPISMDTTQ